MGNASRRADCYYGNVRKAGHDRVSSSGRQSDRKRSRRNAERTAPAVEGPGALALAAFRIR